MRKFLLSLVLATTAAAPALAAPPKDKDDKRSVKVEERSEAPKPQARSRARPERSQAREERTQRTEPRAERALTERVRPSDSSRDRSRFEQRREASGDRDTQAWERANANRRGRPTLNQGQQSTDSVANWRERERSGSSERWRDRRSADIRRQTPPAEARPDRPAPLPQTAQHRERRPEWRSSWRNDHRYDWRNHRRHNRSLFRLGIYFDPFGWNYRRYNIGWRLWPSYYSSNYWLNDPYMYRLPYAPWPYKWVRYYDDALLVDTTTGQVVDVMYDFFW